MDKIKGESEVHYNKLDYFSMSGSCMYSFYKTKCLNTFPLKDKPGFIATCQGFDEYFVGVGKSRSSAIYDWKAKFHCNYQRLSEQKSKTENEESLYKKLEETFDVDVYNANKTTVRVVHGIIASCRDDTKCPCSYRFKGSADTYQVPAYEYVDSSLFLLNKGDRFRGVFEYRNRDYKLLRILYAEKEE